jgi:hypothetical protein
MVLRERERNIQLAAADGALPAAYTTGDLLEDAVVGAELIDPVPLREPSSLLS